MEFRAIDEPTILAVNEVIAQCENARRLSEMALESTDGEVLTALLRRTADTCELVATDLREGLFDTAGEATGDGTVKGYLRRVKEEVGQRSGFRDNRQLVDAVADQHERLLDAFDAALDQTTIEHVGEILAAKRSIVAGLTEQIKAASDAV